MFASTKEAFSGQVLTILQMAGLEVNWVEFTKAHINTAGNAWTGMDDPVTPEWAEKIVDDALGRLHKAFPPKSDSDWPAWMQQNEDDPEVIPDPMPPLPWRKSSKEELKEQRTLGDKVLGAIDWLLGGGKNE
jgi:hypothetical protein